MRSNIPTQASLTVDRPNSVSVEAPARLHLGFLDPGASLGRHYGSIGLALDGPVTTVEVTAQARYSCAGSERARALCERVIAHFGLPDRVAVRVTREIPAHAGLGSGTQLALALGTALTRAAGRSVPAAELAAVLERGQRSGIGINAFEHGGLVVDAGRGAATRTPPLLCRCEFPPEWRVILVGDREARGLSGGDERAAFACLPTLPASVSAHLCHLTMMRLVPGVIERDFRAFASALGELQSVIGDHFAVLQAAGRYTSAAVADAMAVLSAAPGIAGCGQSSWGPTAFAFTASAAEAEAAVADLRAHAAARRPQLDCRIHAARNHGALVAGARPVTRRAAG